MIPFSTLDWLRWVTIGNDGRRVKGVDRMIPVLTAIQFFSIGGQVTLRECVR